MKLSIRHRHAVQREQAEPESLDEFVRNLQGPIYPPKSIVVSYPSGAGVAFKGQVAKALPPGALDMLRQEASSLAPQPLESEERQVIELPVFVVGEDVVSVKVKPLLRCGWPPLQPLARRRHYSGSAGVSRSGRARLSPKRRFNAERAA